MFPTRDSRANGSGGNGELAMIQPWGLQEACWDNRGELAVLDSKVLVEKADKMAFVHSSNPSNIFELYVSIFFQIFRFSLKQIPLL